MLSSNNLQLLQRLPSNLVESFRAVETLLLFVTLGSSCRKLFGYIPTITMQPRNSSYNVSLTQEVCNWDDQNMVEVTQMFIQCTYHISSPLQAAWPSMLLAWGISPPIAFYARGYASRFVVAPMLSSNNLQLLQRNTLYMHVQQHALHIRHPAFLRIWDNFPVYQTNTWLGKCTAS